MKVQFELLDLDGPLAKKGDFESALACYVRMTAASERTDTREITHWHEIPIESRQGIKYFALKINKRISGYAQYRYVSSAQVAIIDYLCIESHQESNASYFSFIELLCSNIEKLHPVSYIVTEINFNLDGNTKDEANRYWIRVLELAGFKIAQTAYTIPSLIIDTPTENRAGVLLIRSNEKSSQMSNKTYINLVQCIYFDHYVAWYRPFESYTNKYHALLKGELDRISASLKKESFVKLNGSLKHAGLVSPEQAEPNFKDRTIYLLLSFGLIFILIVSAAISILSIYAGLSPYTAIAILLISLLIFCGLISVFMPSRLAILKTLIKPLSKIFSGL